MTTYNLPTDYRALARDFNRMIEKREVNEVIIRAEKRDGMMTGIEREWDLNKIGFIADDGMRSAYGFILEASKVATIEVIYKKLYLTGLF